jgi:hypothetical protein
MPSVHLKAEIDVRAPASAAFAVVAADVLKVDDDPGAMTGHRPVDAGPVREGFRWQQTVVHERVLCRTDWTVTAVEEPRLLEQTSAHLCAVARRVMNGRERWEFLEGEDGSTRVTLHTWWDSPGLAGWLGKIFGPRLTGQTNLPLKKRLAYVQFEAERQS